MSRRAITRRFGTVDRFRLLGRVGFVSDDTEQTALVAQALVEAPRDLDRAIRLFRRGLLGWFCRFPWGAGRATLRACGRISLGLRRPGVRSAGNGAAMRAAIIGVFYHDRPEERRRAVRAFAEVTHTDPRAVEGALFVAEVAATATELNPGQRLDAVRLGRAVVSDPELGSAIDRALELASTNTSTEVAAMTCGTSGFVVSTLGFATFLFVRWGDHPLRCWAEGIAAGGDTDTIAAIVGGWMGASEGEAGLPSSLIAQIHDGPFGPTHLRRLAEALAQTDDGVGRPPPGYSWAAALVRNLLLFPVILAHGCRRLTPF